MDWLYVDFPVSGVRTSIFLPPFVAFAVSFFSSIAGVLFYAVLPMHSGISTAPDWGLVPRFGIGGFPGMYCGAHLQRFVPQTFIKTMLALIMLFISNSYIVKYFA